MIKTFWKLTLLYGVGNIPPSHWKKRDMVEELFRLKLAQTVSLAHSNPAQDSVQSYAPLEREGGPSHDLKTNWVFYYVLEL